MLLHQKITTSKLEPYKKHSPQNWNHIELNLTIQNLKPFIISYNLKNTSKVETIQN